MNENSLNDLLLSAIRQGEVPLELTDSLVDTLLQNPAGAVSAASKLRVEWKLKVRMQDAAITSAKRRVKETQPFGRFVQAVRELAGLTQASIAERLGQSEEYIQRLERGDLTPTKIPVPDLASVVGLFNIRISTLPGMVAATATAATAKATYRAAARSYGGIRHDERGNDVERALDAFAIRMQQKKAQPERQTAIATDVQAFVEKLREELARRGRTDLLE